LDHIEQLGLPASAGNFLAGSAFIYARMLVKNLLRSLSKSSDKGYSSQKFAGIVPEEMSDILRRLILATGRFKGLAIGRITDDLYCVYRK
jgi:hypothetical protein